MKKLNNKGVAISVMIYAILLLFMVLMLGILSILGGRKLSLDKVKNDVSKAIGGLDGTQISINSYVQEDKLVHYDGYISPISENGVISWEDLTGYGHQGILNNFDNNEASGWQNNGIVLDGVNDYINISNIDDIKDKSTITIHTTYSVLNNETGAVGVLGSSLAGAGRLMFGYNEANQYTANFSSPDTWFSTTDAYDLTKPRIITIVFAGKNSNTTNKIYINGELVVEEATLKTDDWLYSDLLIGKAFGISDFLTEYPFANMKINNMIIYGRELSESEIRKNVIVDTGRFNVEAKEYKEYANGEAVYFNPTTGKVCKAEEAVSTIGTKTGCMRFFAFLDSKNSPTVDLLLDHNTTDKIRWSEDLGYNGPTTLMPQLASDTAAWLGAELVTDNYTKSWTYENNSYSYTINYKEGNYRARILTYDEIIKITGSTDWASNYQDNLNDYWWLYDRTYNCSYCITTDSGTHGYWLSTHSDSLGPWFVHNMAGINCNSGTEGVESGIRPVITVNKDKLEEKIIESVPTAPTLIPENVKITSASIEASYTASTAAGGIKEYKCYYGDNNNPSLLGEVNETTCVFNNLQPSKTYYFKMCAISNTDNETCSSVENRTTNPLPTYSNGNEVYFNPVTGNKCNASEAVSTTGTKTGCMRWFAYNDNSTNTSVKLLLDHNTTAAVSRINYEQQLASDTATWKYKASVLDHFEVIHLSPFGTANWWLFDRTSYCTNFGCKVDDRSTGGYWLVMGISGAPYDGYYVYYKGEVGSGNGSDLGIRPVIVVPKAKL